MDIAALSTVAAGVRLQQEVSVLTMKKAMDTAEQNSQAMLQVFQASTGASLDPNLGKNIDIKI